MTGLQLAQLATIAGAPRGLLRLSTAGRLWPSADATRALWRLESAGLIECVERSKASSGIAAPTLCYRLTAAGRGALGGLQQAA